MKEVSGDPQVADVLWECSSSLHMEMSWSKHVNTQEATATTALLFLHIVKLREREGQRVDLGRSLKGHLWMVDGRWWYTFP